MRKLPLRLRLHDRSALVAKRRGAWGRGRERSLFVVLVRIELSGEVLQMARDPSLELDFRGGPSPHAAGGRRWQWIRRGR